MNSYGVVIIGRNEGLRLRACFSSLGAIGPRPIVYVDSGSTDDSLEIASAFNIASLSLDLSAPFSAARARNVGASFLSKNFPQIRYIQFVDGDCTLAEQWLSTASVFLDSNEQCFAVFGHLNELFPEASVYNRLCSLEWRSKLGELTDFVGFGGISMIRRSLYEQLSGFREDVIAGEDSEFAARAYLAGFKLHKIDAHMADHDANIHSFRQWWRRTERSGHAIAQRFSLHGRTVIRDCRKELKSVIVWAILFPLILAFILCYSSISALGLAIAGYLYLGFRIFAYRKSLGDSPSDSLTYSFFNVIGKFAQLIGIFSFCRNYLRKRYEIIEYK
jgi:GT2 family glycosyltransferase